MFGIVFRFIVRNWRLIAGGIIAGGLALKSYESHLAKKKEIELQDLYKKYQNKNLNKFQNAAKQILKEIDNIIEENIASLTENEINELKDILHRHGKWVKS